MHTNNKKKKNLIQTNNKEKIKYLQHECKYR